MSASAPSTALIDALAYLDTEADHPSVRQHVDTQIEAELRPLLEADGGALRNLPPVDPNVQAALSRTYPEAQGSLAQAAIAPASEDSVESWRTASERACIALEHERNRLANAAASKECGPGEWAVHVEQTEMFATSRERELRDVHESIRAINAEREAAQLSRASRLATLQAKWGELAFTNSVLRASVLRGESGPADSGGS